MITSTSRRLLQQAKAKAAASSNSTSTAASSSSSASSASSRLPYMLARKERASRLQAAAHTHTQTVNTRVDAQVQARDTRVIRAHDARAMLQRDS